MTRLLQFFIIVCLSTAAFAGENFDTAVTAFTAMSLNQIKSLQDLKKLDLGAANADILKSELEKNGGPPFAPKKIEQSGASTIKLQFESAFVTLDMKEIAKNLIYVNGHKIKLEKNKTYYNYKAEVDEILKAGKEAWLNLLVGPNAYAEGQDPGAFTAWSLVRIQRALGGVNSVENLKNAAVYNASLEAEIIGAYNATAEKNRSEGAFITTKFECEGARLKLLSQGSFDSTAKQNGNSLATLSEMLDGSWSVFNPTADNKNVNVHAKADGTVMIDGKTTNRNLFSEDPFYEFPLVAKRCCQKAGCYEKVKNGFNKAAQILNKNESRGSSK